MAKAARNKGYRDDENSKMPPEADPVQPERPANEICVRRGRVYSDMPEEREPEAVCMYGQRSWAGPRMMFDVHHVMFDVTAWPCKQLRKLSEVEDCDVSRTKVMESETHCEPFPFLCARRCPTSQDRLLAASAHQACTRYTAHA